MFGLLFWPTVYINPILISRQSHHILPQPFYSNHREKRKMCVLSGFQIGHDHAYIGSAFLTHWTSQNLYLPVRNSMRKLHVWFLWRPKSNWKAVCQVCSPERLHIYVQYFALSLYRLSFSAVKMRLEALDVCFSSLQNLITVCQC